MKDGLITAIAALQKISDSGGDIKDALIKLDTMLFDYYAMVICNYDSTHEQWVAVRGNFRNFTDSPFGVGSTSQNAELDLLWKEASNV